MYSAQSLEKKQQLDLKFFYSKLFNTTTVCKTLSLQPFTIDDENKVQQIRKIKSSSNNRVLLDTGLRVIKGKGIWINGKSLEISKVFFFGENFFDQVENVKNSCMKALLNVELNNRDLFSLYDCKHSCQTICLKDSKTKVTGKVATNSIKRILNSTINESNILVLNSKSSKFYFNYSIFGWCGGFFVLTLIICFMFVYKYKVIKKPRTNLNRDEIQNFELNTL